jgi:hypothetical protein
VRVRSAGRVTRRTLAKKSDSTAPEQVVIEMGAPDTSELRTIGGSQGDRFNNSLIAAVISTGWFPPGQSKEDRDRQIVAALTGLQAFKPADEIEGMLAAQATAMHHASMECSRRAMVPDQPFEAAQGLRKAAANASRTFIELLSALDRKRGKGGQQKVTVEHVHVHQGGQAIVGNVHGGDTTAVTKPMPPWRSSRSSPASPWTTSSANSQN